MYFKSRLTLTGRYLKTAAMLLLAAFNNLSAQNHDLFKYRDAKGNPAPVKSEQDWRIKRTQILEAMQLVMGPLPDTRKLPVPDAVFIDSLSTPIFTRYTLHIRSHPKEVVPALLYIPKNRPEGTKVPAVLALHGTGAAGKFLTDSTKAGPNRATATELAYRGYVVLAPDYPSFGDLAGHDFAGDRFESGTMQAVFNHIRCLDYLQSRPETDPERLGVIGHSLGGHNAMFLGAFDERVKIVVASCGWTLFEDYNAGSDVTARFGSRLGPWAQDRYMPLIRDRFGLDPARVPFNFDEVIAAIAPRYFFSNSPLNDKNFNVNGVRKGEKSAGKIFEFLGVPDRLEVHYPEAGHDFPVETRMRAYQKIDSVLKSR